MTSRTFVGLFLVLCSSCTCGGPTFCNSVRDCPGSEVCRGGQCVPADSDGGTGGAGGAGGSGAGGSGAASGGAGGSTGGTGGNAQAGCQGIANCYSVYAHSDTVLYLVDLATKAIQTVGPFNAKVGTTTDVITDLAVAPDNTIYVISATNLYTASAADGHVTLVGSLGACGQRGVALTTLPNGQLWTGDFKGALCQIDVTTTPPTVKPAITMGSGMALTGDVVGIGDGTVFGTAYTLTDAVGTGTQANNVLVKVDLTTGTVTQLGPTGYPKLFGISFALNTVIGFTHDGTGRVVQLDPTTGAGTLFATFQDPTTHANISFAGAGVNSQIQIQ